ncbi:uncharacterized protein LOC102800795 [Saccoglossus kowalevskii]|uniref:Uncharacterized protein LOC102800795 n=1 Tax=Saccoglossus kowalevskii TaxID=10224 RepID=A0ABM0LW90_SACKO|nr:PREDICTED: uncharacterized protein LOC102800795 [Saccoglossus kowalevskii]
MSKIVKTLLFGPRKFKRIHQIEYDLRPGDIVELKQKKRVCKYRVCVLHIGGNYVINFHKGKCFKAGIRRSALGRKVRILNHILDDKYGKEPLPCEQAIARALKFADKEDQEYSNYFLNSEHFVIWCRYGNSIRLLSPSEGRPLPIVTCTPFNTPDLCRNHPRDPRKAPLAMLEAYISEEDDSDEEDDNGGDDGDDDDEDVMKNHCKSIVQPQRTERPVSILLKLKEDPPNEFSYDPEAMLPRVTPEEEKMSGGLEEITRGIEELQVSFTKLNVYFKDYEALLSMTAEMDGDAIKRTASVSSRGEDNNNIASRPSFPDDGKGVETESRPRSSTVAVATPSTYVHVRKWIHDQREILSQLPMYTHNPKEYLRSLNKVITNSQSLGQISEKPPRRRSQRVSEPCRWTRPDTNLDDADIEPSCPYIHAWHSNPAVFESNTRDFKPRPASLTTEQTGSDVSLVSGKSAPLFRDIVGNRLSVATTDSMLSDSDLVLTYDLEYDDHEIDHM